MIKTKFFRSDTLGKLETEVNSFLEEKRIVPHYVKIDYSAVVTGPDDILNTVMITYRTEGSPYYSEISKPSPPSIGTQYVDNEGVHEWNGKEWIHK